MIDNIMQPFVYFPLVGCFLFTFAGAYAWAEANVGEKTKVLAGELQKFFASGNAQSVKTRGANRTLDSVCEIAGQASVAWASLWKKFARACFFLALICLIIAIINLNGWI